MVRVQPLGYRLGPWKTCARARLKERQAEILSPRFFLFSRHTSTDFAKSRRGTCWCGFFTASRAMPIAQPEMPLMFLPSGHCASASWHRAFRIASPGPIEAPCSRSPMHPRTKSPRDFCQKCSEAQDTLAPRGSEKRNLLLPSRQLWLWQGLAGGSRGSGTGLPEA